ncbi:MAG: hypothetical protein WDO24_13345 [Pseudomonadota bacterium]
MRPVTLIGSIGFLVIAATLPASAQSIGSTAALNHVGENMTVCGRVASATVVAAQSMMLSFDQPYPPNPSRC